MSHPSPALLVGHCPWCNRKDSSVTVGIANYRWRIHKCLLVRRSSYFERVLDTIEQDEHLLPPGFPGGAAALDAVVSFCFDSRVPVMRPWNVAALRCAAEFLGMDERRSTSNLSSKADSYLVRVVLRSWPHTLLVLADCYNALLPLAEELGIVGNCLEALATMIVTTIGSSNTSDGGDDDRTWWLEDIVRMPPVFFGRMVRCLRSKGVCERFVGELIVKWTEMWLFSSSSNTSGENDDKNDQPLTLTKSPSTVSSLTSSLDGVAADPDCAERCLDFALERIVSNDDGMELASSRTCSYSSSCERDHEEDSRVNVSPDLQLSCKPRVSHTSSPAGSTTALEKLELLEALAGILPYERTALPVSFLFLLLRYAFAMDASSECKSQIETRISLQLENATLDDFLLPFKSPTKENCERNLELDSMKAIVARFLTQQQRNILSANSEHLLLCRGSSGSPNAIQQQQTVSSVAQVWDQYLSEIACDGKISPQKFSELVEVVPAYARANHDQLYKAIHMFLKAHVDASQHERAAVCRALNCLKLSQESCIQAVQNELMPLRTIIQAMFMQQLQTRNAINSHLRPGGGLHRSPSPIPQQQQQMRLNHFSEKVVIEGLLETNTRLQGLEEAMAQMRKSLSESSATRLSDLFACNDKEVVKNTRNDQHQVQDNASSCRSSSASSSQRSQKSSSSSSSKNWKRKFFQRLTGPRGGGGGSSKGVARVARVFQKMGICQAASRSFPASSFTELPYCASGGAPAPPSTPTGCIPIPPLDTQENSTATKNSNSPAVMKQQKKSSWDDGELMKQRHQRHQQHHHKKHSRQHSVA
ncbi:uncharacterized protein LOC9641490 [Selaginella moellendorffii]|uniref:uncharacterized protein LOC9641490 n=1 Tax=Selaginella moellendorffii TaxID=88036 RepID=UPI000D1C5FBF|nr:uncharacterized protein LOC9641490 [Selaginella moellendorffii]XP_024532444.1 uncharacterized protein LOC9641490 [Selaginella moellendorffii]|eukprot:XP_024532442.1 uncharacterized protein LOC9641490 [Selaginella moellendorffii]